MYDLIIIGGGTAGMTSALYALRSGKKVLLFEKDSFGGQIASSPLVSNYPSIKAISGLKFSSNLFDQIIDLGVEFEVEEVKKISKNNNIFTIETNYANYEARSVIIASGVKHKKINIEKEDELTGHGISYCAVCDGDFFKGKEVAVIGDANTALQYSLLLADLCPKVYICTLFDTFFGEEILVNSLHKKGNIQIINNVILEEFIGKDKLEGLKFVNRISKESLYMNVEGVFIAIGQVPNNEMFKNLVILDKEGYIITDEDCLTKTEGLYAVGDCRRKKIRQLSTAIADGAIAAVNAVTYLNNH